MPSLSTLLAQLVTAGIGSGIGTTVAFWLGAWYGVSNSNSEYAILPGLVSALPGAALGAGLGIRGVAYLQDRPDSFWVALAGAGLGVIAAVALFLRAFSSIDIFWGVVLLALLPSIGATLGFNLVSLRRES
ncbi:MAG TPA: hypothetical protein VFS21_11280 [Roseiflexaceae bacterium]|nr:hypothetical protein [Roseiflexaceae bacterium]